MIKTNELTPTRDRIRQQQITPTVIKNRQIGQEVLKNESVDNISVSLPDASNLIVTTTIASAVDPKLIIALLPYSITVYEGSISDDTQIPFGTSIASGYNVIGPMANPVIPVGNVTYSSNGSNIVYSFYLGNNTGATRTIYIVTNWRWFAGSGGDTSGS